MYTFPEPPTPTPCGVFRLADVAAPPSPHAAVDGEQAVPLPATVLIVVPVTLRIRWSKVSAMYALPEPSTATPSGTFRLADVAAPPSPHAAVDGEQAVPLPATVLIVPPGVTLRIR